MSNFGPFVHIKGGRYEYVKDQETVVIAKLGWTSEVYSYCRHNDIRFIEKKNGNISRRGCIYFFTGDMIIFKRLQRKKKYEIIGKLLEYMYKEGVRLGKFK